MVGIDARGLRIRIGPGRRPEKATKVAATDSQIRGMGALVLVSLGYKPARVIEASGLSRAQFYRDLQAAARLLKDAYEDELAEAG